MATARENMTQEKKIEIPMVSQSRKREGWKRVNANLKWYLRRGRSESCTTATVLAQEKQADIATGIGKDREQG